ncbi:hypothetical protein AVEN_273164-1 [Araneus ventricosus]|uniref:Uncharacterized protein n=1 Tax=Araneus ventricosus TaxID=182803 RepID=A0A4Y2K441_ARAVE|nr:hypothetical protein AVEN_273164-1 [Araneus ventricosus]
MTLSYHFTKPSAENTQLWWKSLLSNKLSRINIAKLIPFLTENKNLIKQPPDATSSSDSDPNFSPSPRPQTYGLRPYRGSIPRNLISPPTTPASNQAASSGRGILSKKFPNTLSKRVVRLLIFIKEAKHKDTDRRKKNLNCKMPSFRGKEGKRIDFLAAAEKPSEQSTPIHHTPPLLPYKSAPAGAEDGVAPNRCRFASS